jgi:PAS domain S-box-containing protein/putative nucleotidyltransferase with HDIG domain
MNDPLIKSVSRNLMPLALLYCAAIFVVLIAGLFGIFLLIYSQAGAYIPATTMQAATSGMLVPLIAAVAMLLVISAVIAWFMGIFMARRSVYQQQLQLYGHLLNISPDAIFLHDSDGGCLYSNEAALMLGSGLHARGQRPLALKEIVHLPGMEKQRIQEITNYGELRFEVEQGKSDGTSNLIEVHSRSVQLQPGKTLIISSARDVTERKKIEEELKLSSEKLARAMEGTIQSMALTSETRDPYTAGHQNRVAKLACAIAREMGLPDDTVEGIRVSGTLHDIGKIFVPAEILSKPGKLRPNEINLLKDHADVGYELLRNIEFPWPVAEIVYQHHERLDGSGYPRGLKEEQIMPEARIMAVADVVEAMASHRPYRPAFSIEKAMLEILQKRDVLYDGPVVDACLRLFNEKHFKLD